MTAELGDWLAAFGESEPLPAAEVGAALLAVLASTDPSDLGIVGRPLRSAGPVDDDPQATVDDAYQQQLDQLQHIRRQVADMANARRAAALALSQQQAVGADAAVVAALAERQAAAQLQEDGLAQLCQRLQVDVDAFRTARETAKARYAAAEASLRVAEVIEEAGGEPDADLPRLRDEVRVAEERLRALRYPRSVTSQVISNLSNQADAGQPPATEPPKPPPPPRRRPEPVPGLLELRADSLGSDIRVLLAVEPADTVTLLAVLEGPQAVSEHGAQAVALAGDLLTEIRGDGWPADIEEVLAADQEGFLARFFPADDGSIARRASVLAAVTPLSRLRANSDLTLHEVATRSGLTVNRVAAIEREGLRTARVHEAVALARALGARLELPAGSGPITG